ncbi:MAG: D-tyrosyl-tRNA(Tyr) deacylase [Lutibacter sp.]|nr:D-tyrosyl-tRNA(Tyr) deacylase [Lutibacter sp.]
MRAVIQRVSNASVTIDNKIVSEIAKGLLVLVGIENKDTLEDIVWLSKKITNLRIFNDEHGVMNNSLISEHGDAIIVSQFTLQASIKKGNRPSYIKAAKPEIAIPIYKQFVSQVEKDLQRKVSTGEFGADMKVSFINDGPVTILIDSKRRE